MPRLADLSDSSKPQLTLSVRDLRLQTPSQGHSLHAVLLVLYLINVHDGVSANDVRLEIVAVDK